MSRVAFEIDFSSGNPMAFATLCGLCPNVHKGVENAAMAKRLAVS